MRETWLQPNRRAIWFGCIPPLLLMAFGAWLAWAGSNEAEYSWGRWTGTVLFAAGLATTVFLLRQLRRPRVAFHNGELLFYLRAGPPIAIPVQFVEAFFLGQGPAHLPGDSHESQRTMNLVARIAQRETAWAHRDVKPALGRWHEGYITIRGTWCEPLTNDVIRRLNRRLKEVTAHSATQKQ